MSYEPWRNEAIANEADCAVEPTSAVSDGSEETVCDFEDEREYDLGEGD